MVRAAKTASLSDDEVVALWNMLFSGLRFRAEVPDAPESSYFISLGKTHTVATSK